MQVAYEYRWGKLFGIQTEAGYVLPYSYLHGSDFIDVKGIKTQLEFRYYFADISPQQQHYVSSEIHVNAINFNREKFELECFDAECTQTFSRRYFYQVKYREQGLTLKYGLIWYRKNVLLDLNWGLRLRMIDYKKPS